MKLSKSQLLGVFFIEDIFNEVKLNEKLMLFFMTSHKMKLHEAVIKWITKHDWSDTTDINLRHMLSKADEELLDNEVDSIIARIDEYKSIQDQDVINDYSSSLEDLFLADAANQLLKRYQTEPNKAIDHISNLEYHRSETTEARIINFKDIDFDEELEKSFSAEFSSTYNHVGLAYPSLAKEDKDKTMISNWMSEQLIMVVGEPGGGKSMYMMSVALEACMKGRRVVYVALGDLKRASFLLRMGAMLTNSSLSSQARKLKDITYDKIIEAVDDRLSLLIVPANRLSVQATLKKLKRIRDQFDVVFLDYDSNFASNQDLSMYLEGGQLYADLSVVSLEWHKLVFVGSQPKQAYWGKSFIPKSGAGESSRKQHFVDAMITIGVRAFSKIPCGTISFVKNRNGNDKVKVRYIRVDSGRFIEVPESVYNRLKFHHKDSISLGEVTDVIDGMRDKLYEEGEIQLNIPANLGSNQKATVTNNMMEPDGY